MKKDCSDDSTSLSEIGDIKLFNSPFSATDSLRQQGISVDGSQVFVAFHTFKLFYKR